MYFILIYLPLMAGRISLDSGNISSFKRAVGMRIIRFSYTIWASSNTFRIRCFVNAEAKLSENRQRSKTVERIAFSKSSLLSPRLSSTNPTCLSLLPAFGFFWIKRRYSNPDSHTTGSIQHQNTDIRIFDRTDGTDTE